MIELFSPNGLNYSLLFPIFMGLIITWFFTERYGWIFSGLVVTGYLAPIFTFRPGSGAMILVEALLTYWIARGLNGFSWRTRWLAPIFGRDRFLAIILVSLLVRLGLECVLLPAVLAQATDAGEAAGQGIGAVGLVVVPLLANLLWKPGAARGMFQVIVVTGAVFLLLHWVLVPLTNFSLGRLEAAYEDVALEFAASAKVEIMIVTGAAIASRLNYYQGWDFGGILLPPLLAVALLEPVRLGATVGEAFAAYYLGRMLFQWPPLSRVNLTGPRLVVLFFSIVVALKFLEGWILHWVAPLRGFTDVTGFGYIISALLASKMWLKGPRITIWPTLLITVVTFVVGTAASLLVAFGVRVSLPAEPAPLAPSVERTGALHLAVLRTSRLLPPPPRRLVEAPWGSSLQSALEVVLRGDVVDCSSQTLERVRARGARTHVFQTQAQETYLAISVPGHPEVCLLRVGAGRVPVVLSLDPGDAPFAAALTAASLAAAIQPDFIVIGAPRQGTGLPPRSGLAFFAKQFPRHFLLEVRGSGSSEPPRLDVYGQLSEHLPPLATLTEALPGLRTRLPGRLDSQRVQTLSRTYRAGLVRLSVGLDAANTMAKTMLAVQTRELPPGYLHVYLRQRLEAPPARYTSRPEWRDLDVLTLKVGLTRELLRPGSQRHLAGLTLLARALDLELELLIEPGDAPQRFLILRDRFGAGGTDGALVVNTASAAQNLHVEVPSPGQFFNTDQAGCLLFLASHARTLALGGIGWPDAGIPAPGVTRTAWRRTLFHVAHQALVETALEQDLPPPDVLQVRGRSLVRGHPDVDGILAPPDVLRPDPARDLEGLAPWISASRKLGWDLAVHDPTSPEDLDTGTSIQARYRRFLGLSGVSGVWLTSSLRRTLAIEPLSPTLRRALIGLGFTVEEGSVLAWARQRKLRAVSALSTSPAVEGHLRQFQRTRSLAALAAAKDAVPAGWSLRVLDDEGAGALVVVLLGPEGETLLINLLGVGLPHQPQSVDAFLRQRAFLLRGRSP